MDFRFAVRTLARNPGFTAMVVLTLGLGIGATSSVFSVVNAVLLRPLPYRDPDRLVRVWQSLPSAGDRDSPTSAANFTDWKERSRVFTDMAAFDRRPFNLTGGERPERLMGASVTPNLFQLLGVQAELGRTLVSGDVDEQAIVVSYGLWQRRFGSDPGILGKPLTLDGKTYQVAGVLPSGFGFLPGTDVWVPLHFTAEQMQQRGLIFLEVIGRLKPGVGVGQAQQDMTAVSSFLAEEYPDPNIGWTARVVSLYEQEVGDVRTTLYILLGAVGFVLLVACANVANLLLARSTGRAREVAVRTALGADRLRLLRQSVTEGLILALLGGLLGLLLTLLGIRLLVTLNPGDIPRMDSVGIDWGVLGFTLALSVLTGLIFGAVPALQAKPSRLHDVLRSAGGQASAGRGHGRARSSLAVAEIALALVLLIGAGLLIQSFQRLRRVDPGFDPENALTVQIILPKEKYPEIPQKVFLFQTVLERLQGLPGVEAAGAVTTLPMSGAEVKEILAIPGRQLSPEDEAVNLDVVTPDYFRAMKIGLVKGRFPTLQDRAGGAPVAIVDEAMARRYWPGEEALGKQIALPSLIRKRIEVVGIVRSVRRDGLDRDPRPQLYIPLADYAENRMDVVVRTRSAPADLATAVRQAVSSVDPDQPVSNLRPLTELVAGSISQQRFNTRLMEVFAALALVLAMVGIYGVLSYSVAQRTHEIGIRMALGARREGVLRLVLGQGMALTALGLILGLLLAFALTRVIASLLFGVEATDPATFALLAAALALAALAACYLPARRATTVDPLVALRYD
jgi:putative ABC transport system permease protein